MKKNIESLQFTSLGMNIFLIFKIDWHAVKFGQMVFIMKILTVKEFICTKIEKTNGKMYARATI
jgi:hypothetical protein